MKTTFKTVIKAFGNNTGIVVPLENLESLQAGKKPGVKVIIGDYEYQSTVATMNGLFLIPLSKEHREKSGLKGDDEIEVTLVLEGANRVVELPDALKQIFIERNVLEVFENQSYSNRKEMVRQIVESKKEETRIKRINQIIEQLNSLKK
ncbi:MAG TPA: YdeI/OmpD-associated family protein [Erysipelotrichaceae bacterium]|nr:YdeI/OmpD-associated family protein [Erysipelotrichaceae bacterium]